MDGEFVYQIEIGNHTLSKTAGLIHVLYICPTPFVMVQLFVYCVYISLGSQTRDIFDSENDKSR